MSTEINRLYRSRDNQYIGGVAGGLGEFFGIDPTIIRLLFIFVSFWAFTGVVVYVIMWVVIPEAPEEHINKVIETSDQ